MPADRDYTVRLNLLHRTTRYTLAPDRIVMASTSGVRYLGYRDIGQLRIFTVYASGAGLMDRCAVRGKEDSILLQSASFAGIGRFVDESPAFRAFVRDLVARVHEANPAAHFLVGMPWAHWVGWVATLIVLGVAVLAGIALMLVGVWAGIALILSSVAAAPLTWRMVRRGPPRPIDAAALQARLAR